MNNNEKKCLEMLEFMLADMRKANPLYAPTEFWSVGVRQIVDEIKEKGLSGFRGHKSANSFFVPLYSRPFYRDHRKTLNPLLEWLDTLHYRRVGTDIEYQLSGHSDAIADYRVFRAADTTEPPFLFELSESDVGGPPEHFVFDNRHYSLSFLNYLKGLVFLKKYIRPKVINSIIEIGGGFGTLGEIMLKADNNTIYIDVDLPPVAAVATYYLREVFGEATVLGYNQTRELEVIDIDRLPSGCRTVILCPWQLPKLRGKFDLFVNFISFQEMEPEVVRNYIKLVQSHNPHWILLRNLREGKKKKDASDRVGVNEPILLDEMVSWFDQYQEVGRDTISFGELKVDNFHSELVVMANKIKL